MPGRVRPAAALQLLGDLVAHDEIRGGRGAKQDGDVSLERELLHQREDRRGADARADEQQTVVRGGVRGEGPVGARDGVPGVNGA